MTKKREKETHRRRSAHQPITLDWMFERVFPEPNSGCWLWMAAVSKPNGYACLNVGKTVKRAHRLAYQLAHGRKLTSKMDVCHRCDVRSCVNPDHLFIGGRVDNMRDCIEKGRFQYLPVLKGEESPNSKLTEADVIAIRSDRRSQRELSRVYGVNKGTIACIRNRKTWRHI